MAILQKEDPISGKTINIARGKVTAVYLNDLKTIKTYSGQNGDWTPTKTMKVKVDNDFIGLGLTDKDVVRAKDKDGNYHDLQNGMEVAVVIQEIVKNGDYTNNNSRASAITILDTSGATETPKVGVKGNSGGKAGSGFKRDTSGMETGHALNCAMNLLSGKITDPEEFLEIAKKLHDITLNVKNTHAKNNPNLDDYAVGASAGNAVINACTLLTKAKIDQVEEKSLSFLEKFSAPLLIHIQELNNPTKKEEVKKDVVKQPEAEGADDVFDDDLIPF